MRILLKFAILMKFRNQAVFAKACGRDDSWASRLITERQDPSPEERDKICHILDVTGDEKERLFQKEDEMRSNYESQNIIS